MGRGSFRKRARRRQADPARYRRGLVPLVPRHRSRELRKSRNRRAHQPAFHSRESRSRRAPRRGCALPIRDQRHFRPGRLAAHRLSHARRQAVFTAARISRRKMPWAVPASSASCSPSPKPSRTRRAEVDSSAQALEEAVAKAEVFHGARGDFDAAVVDAHHRIRRAAIRRHARRLRPRAEIPALASAIDLLLERYQADRRAASAARRRAHARQDGRGRRLRSARRRLSSLFGRRTLVRAALRENVLRQFRAAEKLSARLSGHRQSAVSRNRRRNHRLGRTKFFPTSSAAAFTPARMPTRRSTTTATTSPGRSTKCAPCSRREESRVVELYYDVGRAARCTTIPRKMFCGSRATLERSRSTLKLERSERAPAARPRKRQTARRAPRAPPDSRDRRNALRRLERHVRLRLSGSRARS